MWFHHLHCSGLGIHPFASPSQSAARAEPTATTAGSLILARFTSRTRLLLILLLLAAWAWRLTGLEAQSLWRDEVDSLRFATRDLPQVIAAFTRPGENGPLYYLLLRPWLTWVGRSEYALRFPSALAGVLALPIIFTWARRLFNPAVALIAVLLLAANPYHLWYSQEARMYAVLLVFTMLALWSFAEALERGRWWRWVVWLALTSMCFYIHVLSVLLVPLQIIWLLLIPRWRRRWRSYLAALAFLILPYLPLVWWQWTLLTDTDFNTGHPFVSLQRMLLTLFVAQVEGIAPRPGAWIFAPVIFLLLAALFYSVTVPPPPTSPRHQGEDLATNFIADFPPFARGLGGVGFERLFYNRQWPRARSLALAWWLLPPVGVFLISLFSPVFTDRYLIWTLPAMLLLVAVGAYAVGKQHRWLAVIAVGVLVGVQLWPGWRQMAEPIKSDFRAAATYVSSHRQPDDVTLFLIPYIRHTYQYYDPGPYLWIDAPYANREPDASHLPARLDAQTDGYAGVWLIESEADFYDEQGLTRTWLDAHGALDAEAHFVRVSVYHYLMQQ